MSQRRENYIMLFMYCRYTWCSAWRVHIEECKGGVVVKNRAGGLVAMLLYIHEVNVMLHTNKNVERKQPFTNNNIKKQPIVYQRTQFAQIKVHCIHRHDTVWRCVLGYKCLTHTVFVRSERDHEGFVRSGRDHEGLQGVKTCGTCFMLVWLLTDSQLWMCRVVRSKHWPTCS